jgi:hypothetical protein
MLFGSGGGATIPAGVRVQIASGPLLSVEYAGAAPGLAVGMTQINNQAAGCDSETPGLTPGTVPLLVFSGAGGTYPAQATVAVKR